MNVDLLFWGITLGFSGKLLLGLTVMLVHHKIVLEHRIDMKVIKEMRRESSLAFGGIILMSAGYLLEIIHFGYLPF